MAWWQRASAPTTTSVAQTGTSTKGALGTVYSQPPPDDGTSSDLPIVVGALIRPPPANQVVTVMPTDEPGPYCSPSGQLHPVAETTVCPPPTEILRVRPSWAPTAVGGDKKNERTATSATPEIASLEFETPSPSRTGGTVSVRPTSQVLPSEAPATVRKVPVGRAHLPALGGSGVEGEDRRSVRVVRDSLDGVRLYEVGDVLVFSFRPRSRLVVPPAALLLAPRCFAGAIYLGNEMH